MLPQSGGLVDAWRVFGVLRPRVEDSLRGLQHVSFLGLRRLWGQASPGFSARLFLARAPALRRLATVPGLLLDGSDPSLGGFKVK